tara:strand:- start:182 stop:295 length:114 start_codon:yes stop_codon:yes gene_type:complete
VIKNKPLIAQEPYGLTRRKRAYCRKKKEQRAKKGMII